MSPCHGALSTVYAVTLNLKVKVMTSVASDLAGGYCFVDTDMPLMPLFVISTSVVPRTTQQPGMR